MRLNDMFVGFWKELYSETQGDLNTGETMLKKGFLRVIRTLTHHSNIVSYIPSGSIFEVYILTFFLAFYLASILKYFSGMYADILSGILSCIYSDILFGMSTPLDLNPERQISGQFRRRPTGIYLELAVEVWQCPLICGARGWERGEEKKTLTCQLK